jgi:oxygen-independent coproporphyrinogen-3 oxidase
MCAMAVDLRELCGRHDRTLLSLADELRRLREAERDGLVRVHEEGQIEVLSLGRPFIRSLCAIFDRHLTAGSGRHARPV